MLKRIELLLIVLAILAINLHLLLWNGAELVTIVSLAGLALFYPFLSLALFLDDSKPISIQTMLPGLPFSVALVGILFKLQSWPGFQVNLVIGSLGLVALIIHRYTQKNQQQKLSFNILSKRAIPLVVITLFMLALPKYAWIETKYSEYPEYIKAIKALDENPEDLKLQQELDSLNNHLID
tara:strand:- start:2988 stop:3530 length:543 start_codon:yes stop_codon:yes gene_type:complete